MPNFGNVDHETVVAAVALAERLKDGDYSVRSIEGRGRLVLALNLQRWSGERGCFLFIRCLRLLLRGFKGGYWATWVHRADGLGEERP